MTGAEIIYGAGNRSQNDSVPITKEQTGSKHGVRSSSIV